MAMRQYSFEEKIALGIGILFLGLVLVSAGNSFFSWIAESDVAELATGSFWVILGLGYVFGMIWWQNKKNKQVQALRQLGRQRMSMESKEDSRLKFYEQALSSDGKIVGISSTPQCFMLDKDPQRDKYLEYSYFPRG